MVLATRSAVKFEQVPSTNSLWSFIVPGRFLWFQVGFSGRFLWFFMVPGQFSMVFSRFQVGFSGFQVGFYGYSRFQGGFSRFQVFMVFNGFRSVFFMVVKVSGRFFMIPGCFFMVLG